MSQILDGKKVAEEIKQGLKSDFDLLTKKPRLTIVQVGDDSRSNIYIKRKILFGEEIGAKVNLKKFSENIGEDDLIKEIEKINQDEEVDGIIIQLPIPNHLDKNKIIESININKDVDGLKVGSKFIPATARGVISLLKFYGIGISGKKVTVLGRSALVGAPIAKLMEDSGAKVTVCHSGTEDLVTPCKDADIIISAVGKRNLINKSHVKSGQIVIDVGINPSTDNVEDKPRIVGDVNFREVVNIVDAISPVPGGVGPMTVASLFLNLSDSYYNK